jgi:copper chaperone CopZ
MRIRILYFEGCPNHATVVELARRIAAERGLNATVEEVEVAPNDVARLRFLGSPTVQVDSVDIEPAARERTDFAMSCRVYDTPDGLPSESMFLDALEVSAANPPEPTRDRAGFMAIGGSVGTAMLSSACCWLPLLLLTFGLSAGGMAGIFDTVRPYFLILAALLLGTGFYLAYFRGAGKAACQPCKSCAASNTNVQRFRGFNRAMLWVATVFVIAFALFPYYSGALFAGGTGSNSTSPAVSASGPAANESETHATTAEQEYAFSVDGMYCVGCAATLQTALRRVDGVKSAGVSYSDKQAVVRADAETLDLETLTDAAQRAGFPITLSDKK